MKKFEFPPLHSPAFSTYLSVRIANLNYGNHLGNDAFVTLIYEALVEFIRSLGFSELNIENVGIIVSNLIINYQCQAFYKDNIKIDIGVGEIEKTRLDFHFRLTLTDKPVAKAIMTIAFYDYQAGKVARIPQTFVEAVRMFERVSE